MSTNNWELWFQKNYSWFNFVRTYAIIMKLVRGILIEHELFKTGYVLNRPKKECVFLDVHNSNRLIF